MTIRTSTSLLLGALAVGGAALAVAGQASAAPGGGFRHGPHHPHHGHGIHRHHGHHHIWRGHYGPRFVGYGGGYRCRFVRRVNAYGELVVRRVCFNPYY